MKAMMRVTVLLLLWTSAIVQADVGVFTGTGQDLRQITNASIQLTLIDVTIFPHRGPALFDGGVRGLDAVRYDCRFILKNLTDKECDIKVGFPLDTGFAQNARPDSTLWVTEFDFIARDEKATYHVTFEPRYSRENGVTSFAIFTWPMHFAAKEVKDLHVHYRLPMSMTAASTRKKGVPDKREHDDTWLSRLELSIMEIAGYTTETGSSWAGKVEVANFRIMSSEFERYLDQRGWEECSSDGPARSDGTARDKAMQMHAVWHREAVPLDWKPIQYGLRWEYRNFKPKEPISLMYYLLPFPRHGKDVDAWIDSILNEIPDKATHTKVLSQIEEVLLALSGKEPMDPQVLAFAKDQVWYQPQANFNRSKLTKDQDEVLQQVAHRLELAKSKN